MSTKSKTTTPKKKVVKKAVVKKTAKTTKKVAPKKAVSKSKKVLVYADEERSFWSTDGQVFNNLMALHNALKSMDKGAYMHHVTKDKNDFAEWVEHVLCDSACALDLRKSKTPVSAHTTVAKHLKLYKI